DAIDAARLPNSRSLNVALLGLLSVHLDIPESCWHVALKANLPEKVVEANLAAFALGKSSKI
ncbi:MAG: pyruvate ferredoxin oxidoreductase, partial [Phycisphaerae bacterium]|nr:pyruvate ferredoxin oxidoreductase [Phycisphaerae bacterium]